MEVKQIVFSDMRPIQPKLRNDIATNGVELCEVGDNQCFGHLEWHHPFIHAGRQINESWAIIKICTTHHDKYHAGDRETVDNVKRICLLKATDEDLKKYPKTNWDQLKRYLDTENYKRQDAITPF